MKKRGARLGQHFLHARWAARSLAYATGITAGERVLEIGPGKGALTRELLAIGGIVTAIEKDDLLVATLHEMFVEEISAGKLTIVSGDIRDIEPETLGLSTGNYVVAANIPYYITGEIIRQFLTTKCQPRAMALLIQKEVAQRITAKRESLLSLSVKVYGTPRIIEKVSRKCFSPEPSVDSAILLVDNISRDFFADLDENHFFGVLHAGFASKRKFLANNLGVKLGKDSALAVLTTLGINERARAEDIAMDEWKLIAKNCST
jgi:16S rRNA (adenine1518-N6/adenine1519-N6)-dimethyltransferase